MMPEEKDDNPGQIDRVRGDRGLARPSGFIGRRVRDLARDVKDRELVGRGENNGFEREWGGEGSGPGEFNRPTAIAVDKEGNVLVADTGNRRIQKFDSTGRFLDAWGLDTDDSDKLKGESDLQIFVDDTGTVSLTSSLDWGSKNPVAQLDSKEGVLKRRLFVNWYLLYGFIHPEGHTYIRHEEGTQGWDEILRFSKDGYITGRWGSQLVGDPELPYPMEYPLFSDINGDIYSLFPSGRGMFGARHFLGMWLGQEKSGASLNRIVQDCARVIHLPTGRCRAEQGDYRGVPYREEYDSEFLPLESSEKLCHHTDLGGEITIGRSSDNMIVVDGSTVSRHHARIEFSEGAYFIEDLGSKNGTTVNGARVTRVRLGSQSSIKVGKETVKFFCPAWVPRLWQMLSEIDSDIVRDDEPFFVEEFHRRDSPGVILKFSPECELIEVWAPKLRDPHLATGSFAVNVDGDVFFLCGECNEVKGLSKDGNLVNEWGEEGAGPGQFDGPMGIAAGPTNEIYVADTGNHRIQKFRALVKA